MRKKNDKRDRQTDKYDIPSHYRESGRIYNEIKTSSKNNATSDETSDTTTKRKKRRVNPHLEKQKPVDKKLQKKARKEKKSLFSFKKNKEKQNRINKEMGNEFPENKSIKKTGIIEKNTKKKKINTFQLKLTGFLAVSATVFTILCLLLLSQYSEVAEAKYRINKLNKTLIEVKNQKDKLHVKLEGTNRSDIIEKYARENLGMEYPKEDKITYIRVQQ